MSTLTDQIQSIREERDSLRLQLRTERAERMTVSDELAGLRERAEKMESALRLCLKVIPNLEVHNWPPGWQLKRDAIAAAKEALRAEVEK